MLGGDFFLGPEKCFISILVERSDSETNVLLNVFIGARVASQLNVSSWQRAIGGFEFIGGVSHHWLAFTIVPTVKESGHRLRFRDGDGSYLLTVPFLDGNLPIKTHERHDAGGFPVPTLVKHVIRSAGSLQLRVPETWINNKLAA